MKNPNSHNSKLRFGEDTKMVLTRALRPAQEKLLDIAAELCMIESRMRALEQWDLCDEIRERVFELRLKAVRMRMKK